MSYKGSEWNKWDLHIHTPESGMANEFGNDWDKYVQSLFRSASANYIVAIMLTDYFTIDGYTKLLTDYLEDDDKLNSLFTLAEISSIKNITIFPNIEFRLKTIVNRSRINYHIIFSNEVEIEDIEENFLHEIEFVHEGLPFDTPNKRKLKRRNIEEHGRSIKEQQEGFNGSDFTVGCTTAVIDEQQITEILFKHKDKFDGKYIIVIPVDEDLSKIPWRGQDHMVRKYFYQVANMFFATNKGTIDFGLGKKHDKLDDYLSEFKTFKPCICGSDAHSLDSLCVFPNGLNTNAGCVTVCPTGCLKYEENGVVSVSPEKCIGCRYCEMACPFDVPRYYGDEPKIDKCTMCWDRLENGMLPACVKTCQPGALHFGPRDEMSKLGQERV